MKELIKRMVEIKNDPNAINFVSVFKKLENFRHGSDDFSCFATLWLYQMDCTVLSKILTK